MTAPTTQAPPWRITVVLLGNPNTGKTTLFNALSGLNHRVGNYAGVTVESKKGTMSHQGQTIELIDLPGTYSLAPRSPDEMVAVDVLLGQQAGEAGPDVVLSIVDASNLERNLYLTTQILELGIPVVVALNMIDLAEGQGIRVDADELSKRLGVPVVAIQANKKIHLDALRSAIAQAAASKCLPGGPTFPPPFEQEVQALREQIPDTPDFLLRRLLLDVGGYTEKRLLLSLPGGIETLNQARARLQSANCPVPAIEARTRYAWIRQALAGAVQRPAVRPANWTDRLDRVLTHKVWGTLIFLVVMCVLFVSIYPASKPIMELIDAGKTWLAETVASLLPPGAFTDLLTDGVIGGVGAVVIFLPQILILFAFIALLEDCGYMARAAFLMDRLMARAGLSGKSFIPLLSSMACAVPGIMATRVIEDRRDRLATILVAPLMSCSARLPVYTLLTGAFFTDGYAWWVPGLVMFSMYLIGLIVAPLVAFVLKRTLLRGQTPVFVMEMPTYKRPSLRTVARRVWDAAFEFTKRAGTVILATMVLVWALLYFPAGEYPEKIRALEAPVKKDREELKKLEESIADEMKELRRIEKAEQTEGASEKLQDERKEILEKIAPTLAEMKPLKDAVDAVDAQVNPLNLAWKRQSVLGQFGEWMEPAVRPLGWDWRIGVAALASFPAREVVVGTLGILFSEGKTDSKDEAAMTQLGSTMSKAERGDGTKLFSASVALSLMVFFALCCQCASTLAVIRRETKSWWWPTFTFVYMTGLAYVAALVVYQVGRLLG